MKAVKQVLLLFIIYLCISSNPVNSFNWDPLGLGKNIEKLKQMIKDALDQFFKGSGELIEKAKAAFSNAMDQLFDEKIMPMIYEIQAMIRINLNQINDMIQQTIDHFVNAFTEMITNAAHQAQELIDKTLDEIQKKIIETVFDRADSLMKQLNSMIENVMNFIDNEIYMASCAVQAVVSRIFDKISTALPWWNPLDRCRVSIDKMLPGHNLRWKLFSSYLPNELYQYRKCSIFKDITETTPIPSILLAYRDLELLAGDMRCMAVAYRAVENQAFYIAEMGECVKEIELYQHQVIDVFARITLNKFLSLP
jgi:hypothetical protein